MRIFDAFLPLAVAVALLPGPATSDTLLGPEGREIAPPSAAAIVLPLSFHFAAREEGHEFLITDVAVTIDDAATQRRVLQAVSEGPFLQTSIPEGRYHVTATHQGRAQAALIVVERGEPQRIAFYW